MITNTELIISIIVSGLVMVALLHNQFREIMKDVLQFLFGVLIGYLLPIGLFLSALKYLLGC